MSEPGGLLDPEEGPGLALPRLETARTFVRLPEPGDAGVIARYYSENRNHLQAFDPERPPYFYERSFWRREISRIHRDFAADRSLRLIILPRQEPARVIGTVGFSNFVRGPGQYCTLGYAIAAREEGKGLMFEALRPSLAYVFDALHFHRIEANHLPHNVRSAKLLARLKFEVEGYSREYLRIDGRWQDHVRTALLNPRWLA